MSRNFCIFVNYFPALYSRKSYLSEKISGDKDSYDFIFEYLEKFFTNDSCKNIYFLIPKDYDVNNFGIKIENKSKLKFMQIEGDLKSILNSFLNLEGEFDIIYIQGDQPLINYDLSIEMLNTHQKYFNDYSFASGYPEGLAPEIIKKEIIKQVLDLQKEEDEVLFDAINRDINAFDIDTCVSDKDYRIFRINFSTLNKIDYLLTSNFLSLLEKSKLDIKYILKCIDENQNFLRTIPSFYNIQISSKVSQNVVYSPFSKLNFGDGFMKLDQIKTIVSKAEELSDTFVISLSLWGECALHPQIYEIIKFLEKKSCIQKILIETAGIDWDKEKLLELKIKKTIFILHIETIDKEIYKKMRGDGFEKAMDFAEFFIKNFEDKTYIQATRTKINEENLQSFYKFFKNKTDRIIIQKFSRYPALVDNLEVLNLEPLKRFACWHIKRDFTILINGDVLICKEDVNKENLLGNIFKDDIIEIWNGGFKKYVEHIKGKYEGICKECDEYYTYNF